MKHPIQFFFDTANHDYIEDIWDLLAATMDSQSVLGVTTNPNALSKIGCVSLKQLRETISKLCILITHIRQNQPGGVVFVQLPYSLMHSDAVLDWARYVSQFGDGTTKVALKIPHYTAYLELAYDISQLGLEVNVTGIADWGTILKAFAYNAVTYASLIPGRMEEKGIPARLHMSFIADIPRLPHQEVIAGSMRTVTGLVKAIARNTIPTIGERVWNELLTDGQVASLPSFWNTDSYMENMLIDHAPLITDENRRLSVDFFSQMDALGDSMYREFKLRVTV